MNDICFASINHFMRLALKQAEKAYKSDIVPVGALIVYNDAIISKSYNSFEVSIMHAELACILDATQKLKTKYLNECSIFVTHEPCEMCYQAMLSARIKRVFFGSYSDTLYHDRQKIEYYGGISTKTSQLLLQNFFTKKRKKNTVDLSKI